MKRLPIIKDPEAIYLKLPVVLQHAICCFEGYRIQQTRFDKEFIHFLNEVEKRTFWSPEKIQTFRNQRLQNFIRHAVETVPYYRKLFKQLKINPHDIQNLDDLRQIPVLTKDEVQQFNRELISEKIPESQRIIAHTSGTTGGGLRFATTRESSHEQWATWWRYRGWHGIQLDTWCGYFGGRSIVPLSQKKPPFWRYNYPGKQIIFSAYHLNQENLSSYIAELRRRKPPWLHGYPSVLAIIASYVVENKSDLGYQVKWVTIGAENLTPNQNELIRQAFGVAPKQHYGMAEAVANISECEYGNLHVDEDFAAVEFIPNPEGEGFKVIGTNFTNLATPLIRYDIQDIVTLSEKTCPCGRPGRLVERIDGRQEDYVILKNGAKIGRLDHIFKDLVHIKEAQIYQCKPGETVLRIVPGKHYTQEDETRLLYETRKRLGEETNIIIEYTEKLPRTKTGKLRFVVSEVTDGKLSGRTQ